MKCINCELPLVPNHHPNAGKPEHINTVGCQSGCLPCAEKRANGRRQVITSLRMWLEDESQKSQDDNKRRRIFNEVLDKLNRLEESRRIEYQASR